MFFFDIYLFNLDLCMWASEAVFHFINGDISNFNNIVFYILLMLIFVFGFIFEFENLIIGV